jgi:hypothetical protein
MSAPISVAQTAVEATLQGPPQFQILLTEQREILCYQSFRQACCGRCFGISEIGYMGLFLPGSQTTDCIFLFTGTRLPFTVRLVGGNPEREGSQFKLVGPAYIEGTMDVVAFANELSLESIKIY